jgi:hypothetical protein
MRVVPRANAGLKPARRTKQIEPVAEQHQVNAVDRQISAIGPPTGPFGHFAQSLGEDVERARMNAGSASAIGEMEIADDDEHGIAPGKGMSLSDCRPLSVINCAGHENFSVWEFGNGWNLPYGQRLLGSFVMDVD